ncbi:Uncharacterised protein [Clostridioides difficile]|nr:Uncharacterised protein [Clostridioides difficile]
MLRISDVKKKFGDTEVLKGINLNIAPGEILQFVKMENMLIRKLCLR